jgi:hypothetical protein
MANLLSNTTIGGYQSIHTGNIGSYAITSLSGYATQSWVQSQGYITNLNQYYYVNPGAGNGIGFWNQAPTTYGITMAHTSAGYGSIYDNSEYYLYFSIGNGSGRGFMFRNDYGVLAQIATNGWLMTRGEIYPGYNNNGGAGQTSYYIYGNTNNSGLRTNGNWLVNGNLYIGARDVWFTDWFNQDLKTSASPSFSTVNVNTLNSSDTNARYYYQSTNGVPSNNLGNPTVTEMALFDEQFNNKTAFYDPTALSFWTSSDGVNFTEYTGFSTTDKKRFLGGDGDSGVNIPNLTNRFRIELENTQGYVFLNQLYIYWSSNSHSTKVHIWVRRCDNNQWYQWTDSNTQVSSWPGHLYLPFGGIPFYPGALASNGHFNKIRIEFIPTWSSGTYSYTPINLMRMQIWGGYPAGKRNIYSTDENQNVSFPASITAGNSVISTNYQATNAYYLNGTSYFLNSTNGGIYTNARFETAGNLVVGGNSYLGNGNGDEVHINDILRVGATDSGDAHFFFGEGGSAGSDYGSHWYWDSGYTFTWNTRNAGTDTALFDYVTNDTTYVNWRRNFHMQDRAINYTGQLHFSYGTRFEANSSNYLNFKTDSTGYGGIQVRDGNSTIRGYSGFFDGSGFGLLNSTGNWGIRLNPGNAETLLYYAGNERLRTDGSGAYVTGRLDVSNYIYTPGSIIANNIQGGYQVLSLDTIKNPGLYQYDGGIGGTQPLGVNWYNLRTIEIGNDGRYTQVVFPYSEDRAFFRRQTGATWGSWYEFIHSGNIGSQSVSYASTAGTLSSMNISQFTNNSGYLTSVPAQSQLISPNGASVVAADLAMPNAGHSFIHTLGLGPGGNDGHILGMSWAGTTSMYGAQIFIDTDPNDIMAIRSRSSSGVWTSWKTVYHTGNFTNNSSNWDTAYGWGNHASAGYVTSSALSSYVPLSGTTLTEGNYFYFRSNRGAYLGALDSPSLQVYATGGNAAFMSFHRGGSYAVNFGLDADNVMRIGGWSAAADLWVLDMGGNNTVAGSFRAPIFYDSNDTNYYLDLNSTSNSAMRIRGGALFGPNPTWGAYLRVGSDGNSDTNHASVVTTNGNLHIDPATGHSTYINYYVHGPIYLNGDSYYISSNGSYYNGTAAGANSVAWTNVSGRPAALSQFTNDSGYITSSSLSSYLPLAGGTMSGQIYGPNIGTGTYDGLIQIRETGYVTTSQSAWGYAPGITYHWGGRVASKVGLRSDGLFAINDEPFATRSWVSAQGFIAGESDTLASVTGRGATTASQMSFTKTDDHAISVGTIRGRAVGVQTGEFIQLYERVNIGGPSGWGASNTSAPTYGLSVYGGATIGYGNSGGLTVTGTTNATRYTLSGTGAYMEGYGSNSSKLGKVAMISFDWNSNYDEPYNHGIMSTNSDANFADSLSVNSFNDITLRLDSNNNNSESYLRIMNNTAGVNTIAYIGYNGSNVVSWFDGSLTANGYMSAPIYYDSDNGSYYGNFASTSVMNAIRFGGSTNNGTLSAPGDWGVRVTTDAGYIQFGPANSSYAHIYTDRDTFYFNRDLLVNGNSVITSATIGSQSVTYAINSTRLYASDSPYTYSGTNPYYMYMNYDGGSYWELKVSPATPGAVRVAYSNVSGSANSVAWTNVSSRPTALSQFSNDLGNYGGWITSSGSISGNAATATNVAWSGVTSKPAGWLNTDALVQDMEPSATAFPSGFYQSYLGSGNPTGTWFNYINVRHSNTGNGHGFQLGMSYYDTNLWFRSYQGSTSPTFSSWAYAISSLNIGSQSVNYANSAGSAGSATSASQLTKYGDIYGQDWNGYYLSGKFIAAAVLGMTGSNKPPTSYDYGVALSYGESGGPLLQWYFPENSANGTTIFKKGVYRTGWNGNWSTWKTLVEQEGNLCTIVGGNGTGLEVHGNVGYNQDPLTYFLIRGQADTSWKAVKIRLTGDAGGQDIEFRRIAENGADSRMWYVPRGANTVNFDYPIVQPSDSRLKDNITPITTPVEKIKALSGVEFDWNSGEQVGTHDVGLIAQDVEAVLPEAVTTQEDGYKNLAYTKVIPLLVEAMKEQQTMIEALRAEIELLKNK